MLATSFSLKAKETVKIGAILPLSGPAAFTGEDMRDALKITLENLNKTSKRYEYKLLFEDSQNAPRLAVEAFKKLTEIDKVDAVLSFLGGPGSAISPIATNKGVLHIGCGFATAIAKGPLNFNNLAKPEGNAALMIKYLQALGYKRVAMIKQVHASSNALVDEFNKQLAGTGIEVVSTQRFTPGERDFRVAILKIREAKPEIVFVNSFSPEAAIILRQMKDIQYNPPITGMGHWGLVPEKEIQNIPWVELSSSKTFIDDFKEKYKRIPVYFAGYSCDSLEMYAQACESYTGPGKPSPQYIAKAFSC